MSSEPVKRLGVVVACEREDGRWLMMRRSAQVLRAPLKIGLPGGEIEPGETQQQAVIREMHEELNLRVEPTCCVWQYDLPDRPWRLYGWRARIVGGVLRPDPAEVAEVHWLTAEEAAAHPDALPTNALIMAVLSDPKAPPLRLG
ncbi:MAG: NUDIX domain-containing protein [Phycisphaeraceae bacterium]